MQVELKESASGAHGECGRSSLRVRAELTESAEMVDFDDEFSWC